MKKAKDQPAQEAPPGKTKIFKCSDIAFCEGLDNAFDDVRIRLSNFMNVDTGKPTASLPTIYAGVHTKKGIIMNFCPFCGHSFASEIRKVFKKAKKK